jgi:hypothetical protein
MTVTKPRVSLAEARERLADAELELDRAKDREKEARANTFLHPRHLEAFHRETQEAARLRDTAKSNLKKKLLAAQKGKKP